MKELRLRSHAAAVLLLAGVMGVPLAARAQIPNEFQNLKVLPKNITRDSLLQIMRGFSFATGLRCEGCHVLGENNSFQDAKFHLDEKLNKRKARYMLEMVNRLNSELLPGLPERSSPGLAVECKTCHRGLARPYLLRTELRQIVDEKGVAAAVARYRELRERSALMGAYDFREWEMNELAAGLIKDGKPEAAIPLLQLNEEFHPESASIPALLGQLFERAGNKEEAIASYNRALTRNPQDNATRARLRALTGGG